MNKLKCNLKPSEQLILSCEVMNILSRTFQAHGVDILEKGLNESLSFKISFTQRRESLVQQLSKYRKETKGKRHLNKNNIRVAVFDDMMKALSAEIASITRVFELRISTDEAIIETRLPERFTELSAFYLTNYIDQVISLIREGYEAIGERVSFAKVTDG